MSDRPAYSCGATGCCTGGYYPECQENFSLGHYQDEQTTASPHTFTD